MALKCYFISLEYIKNLICSVTLSHDHNDSLLAYIVETFEIILQLLFDMLPLTTEFHMGTFKFVLKYSH